MPYCYSCGDDLSDDYRFCPECGADQESSTSHGGLSADVSSFAGRTLINGLVGGTTGFIVGLFIASIFAPLYVMGVLAGAALGGYLQGSDGYSGAKVGALSGLVATAPVMLLIILAAAIGFGTLAMGVLGHVGIGESAAGFGVIAFFISLLLFLAVITNVLFGGLGGVVGAAIRENQEQP